MGSLKRNWLTFVGLALIVIGSAFILAPALSVAKVSGAGEQVMQEVHSGDTVSVSGCVVNFYYDFDEYMGERVDPAYLSVYRWAKIQYWETLPNGQKEQRYDEVWCAIYGAYEYFYSKAPPDPLSVTINFSKTRHFTIPSWYAVKGAELVEWLNRGMIVLLYGYGRYGNAQSFRLYVELNARETPSTTTPTTQTPPSESSEYPAVPQTQTGEPDLTGYSESTKTAIVTYSISQTNIMPYLLVACGVIMTIYGLSGQKKKLVDTLRHHPPIFPLKW